MKISFLLSIPNIIISKEIESYGIMLDAGSSGTAHLFNWNETINGNLPEIKETKRTINGKIKTIYYSKEIGLSNIEPFEVDSYLKEIIQNISQHIPKDALNNTIIFLKATAGMREINIEKSNALISAVRSYLLKSGFIFDPNWAQVISGEYEGLYGWISLNYIKNKLKSVDSLTLPTLGLGGSSVQITFEPEIQPIENSFPLNLYRIKRVLYSHSYLKFGREDSRKRYHLLKRRTLDPCYIQRYREKIQTESGVINITGIGNYEMCLQETKSLIIKSDFCPTGSCAINGVYMPLIPNDVPIFLTDGFSKIANFFGCKNKSTIKCIKESSEQICTLDIEEYKLKNSKHLNDKDFNHYCFSSAYIVNLLTTGFDIDEERELEFVYKINDVEVGWPLGAMIYEVNALIHPDARKLM